MTKVRPEQSLKVVNEAEFRSACCCGALWVPVGGQVQHGWASVPVNVFLYVEYDSRGAFTSVIVLVEVVADVAFLWWGPTRKKRRRKVGLLNGFFFLGQGYKYF